jgi:sigma-B regulation protein RsbU (phosphoserine phosphatase)
MATLEQTFLHGQLMTRRERLEQALRASPRESALADLLRQVDAALERMAQGTYGLCETCHDPVEQERLLADPLTRFCLGDLTTEQRQALQRDLELAAEMQRSLLPPKQLRVNGWEASYLYQPLGPVSGDYCDLIQPEQRDSVFFVVGDVSGKGVAASLLMTQLHGMFRSLSSVGLPLDEAVSRANRLLCESALAGQFATLVCGRAERGGRVEICNAGHLPVLHLTKDGVRRIESSGLPLGMFSTHNYALHAAQLDRGDALVLYTDGFTEAQGGGGTEYGIERLERLLGSRHGLPVSDLTQACLADLRSFRGTAAARDDLTLLALHRDA